MQPMDRERIRRIKEIYLEVVDAGSDGSGKLDELCGPEADLRAEVVKLLEIGRGSEVALDRLQPGIQKLKSGPRYFEGDLLAGRYRILGFLAAGGMGEVYAALDERGGAKVAIKCLKSTAFLDETAISRLRREVRMASELSHPNICRVFGMEEHNGELFCVMELLEGETLSARIARQGKLTAEEVKPIAGQILDGLEYAHWSNVVHRDLKPANVMLTDSRAVLIDFGLAVAAQPEMSNATESLTATGAVIGTLAYISPEQLQGGESGPRSDLYSFGVVLFEMIAGVKPHESKSPFQLAAQKSDDSSISGRLNRMAPPDVLAEAIAGCLKADPERRFQSAGEVRRVLDQTRASWQFRLKRRKKLAIALVGATGLTIAALAGKTIADRDYVPGTEAAAFYTKGEANMVGAAPYAATKELEQAVAADGKFLIARAALATAYMEIDQADRAREALLRANDVAESKWILGRRERWAMDAARAAVVRRFEDSAEAYRKIAEVSRGAARSHAMLGRARMLEAARRYDLARSVLEALLGEDTGNQTARVRLAVLLCRARDYKRAEQEFGEAERAYRQAGNIEGLTELLLAKIAVLATRDASQDARTIEDVRQLARQSGNVYQALNAEIQAAMIVQRQRDYDGAIALMRKATDEALRLGMPVMAARGMGSAGYGFLFLKRPDLGIPLLRQGLDLAHRSGSESVEMTLRMQLGEAIGWEQHNHEAVELMEPAVSWLRKFGNPEVFPLQLVKWGTALSDGSRWKDAEPVWLEALALAEKLGNETYQGLALDRLGRDLVTRDLRRAAGYWDRAVKLAERNGLTAANYHAAYCYSQLGRFGDAERSIAQGDRIVAVKYRAGVDRDSIMSLADRTRSELAILRGDCALARKSMPVKSREPVTRLRALACGAGARPDQIRDAIDLATSELKGASANSVANFSRAIVMGRLALRDWAGANRDAERGIRASLDAGKPVFELELQLELRAALRALGDDAGAEAAGHRAMELARQVGFDPPEKFGGRTDLDRLWRGMK